MCSTILSNKKARSDCILAVIYNGDTYGIRTHEPGVRGRCLNHLTKVPHEVYYHTPGDNAREIFNFFYFITQRGFSAVRSTGL